MIEKGEIKVTGIAWNGSYSQMNMIPALFDQMEARIGEVLQKTNEPFLIAPFHSRETEFT
ncbi:hypothetical protein PB1_10849 [Bacillus methanolicus PB1]|uniref:Uncharacterized protein n=1 Tax=Bacillus methanolicus PB1 TaxID=997296 RepID=I3DUY3_BACMT|nr:hypothetical protein PB1_10849 [Bacillus methanolicus PB1]